MSLATLLASWVALTAHFSVLSNAALLPSNALTLSNAENKIKIELIDVKCDKNEDGMHVTIKFSQPFEGIIYSQGYFNDPKCRYVSAGEGDESYNFVVPFEGCGSKASCAICDSVDNILVIQQDEEVQGEFDAARKISCSRTGVEEEKKVYFKPFIVQNLDVITVPTKHGGVDCWMDIQRGVYPRLTPIGEVIKIGEELTVLVYLRDPKKEYDLTVRNCWAYNSEDFDDKKTGKVQLSDSSGCTMKRKLFGSWHKTDQTGSSGATLQLYNTLRAFKFPDESQVYLKCDIEICRGNCAEAICDADDINNKVDIAGADINKVDCALDPLHEKCIRNKIIDRSGIGFTTIANQPRQPSSTSAVSTRVPFADSTRRPSFIFAATTQRPNYISTTFPDEVTTTLRPLMCTPYSQDIRCIQTQYTETTEGAETTTLRETTTNQNYLKVTTFKPGYDSFCSLYPKHKRCNQRVTDEFGGNYEILTFKPPSPFATVKYQPNTDIPDIPSRNLEYVSTTETASITEQPLNCNGPYLDPRCPNPARTGAPPTYLPPSTTKKVNGPTFAPRCYPGSLDPRCPQIDIATTKSPITTAPKKFFICVPGSSDNINCDDETSKVTKAPTVEEKTIPPRNQLETTEKPEKPVCFYGSTNPECQKVSTQTLIFKPRPTIPSTPPTTTTTTTTTDPFIGTTRAPICYPGSLDSRCVKPTKTVPVSFGTESGLSTDSLITSTPPTPSTTRAPICYPGSIDPRCPKQTTTKKIIPEIVITPKVATDLPETTTYIPTTAGTPICYLGSQDPRCRQSTTKRVSVSYATESDLSTRPKITTTPTVPSTTRGPFCYPGSLDPRCAQQTTKKSPEIFDTTRPPISLIPTIPSTTRAPVCYPGALDPRCQKPTTQKPFIPTVGTTQEASTEKPTASAPRCYPGSLDSRCIQSTTKRVSVSFGTDSSLSTRLPISTPAISTPSTTRTPICYLGSFDARCRQPTTEKPLLQTTKQIPTFNLISSTTTTTTIKPTFSPTQSTARCYPGSLDPRCSSKKLVVPLECELGVLDPRCPNPTPTAEPATYLPPKPTSYSTQKSSITTTSTQPFICTLNSLDPRCRVGTTLKFIPSVTAEATTAAFSPETTQKVVPTTTVTQRPTSTRPLFSFPPFTTRIPVKISTTNAPFVCSPNSLDPQCKTITTAIYTPSYITTEGSIGTFAPETTTRYVPPATTTTTFTQKPTTTRPPFSFPTYTTRPPTKLTTTIPPFICTPNSFDPRCRIDTTTKTVPIDIPSSTTTSAPETTTKRPQFSYPTFPTRRIISSPQPFTTRPTTKLTSTTTESVLCYPGSTIEGCKKTFTTPAYCFPGSRDPRCPQLPPSFSTRQPSTYLPPFPDARLNRVRRQTLVENDRTQEIVKFSLSFKPFNFS